MKENHQDIFCELLETDVKENIINAMREWCGAPRIAGVKNAALVSERICFPLWAWIDKEVGSRKEGNYNDIIAAKQFAVTADDIARHLQYSLNLYPEHVNLLATYWDEFLRKFSMYSQQQLVVAAMYEKKIKDGAKKGHEVQFGTVTEKANERALWQKWVDAVYHKHPKWTFETIKGRVVKEHPNDVSLSKLKRHTKNPRNK